MVVDSVEVRGRGAGSSSRQGCRPSGTDRRAIPSSMIEEAGPLTLLAIVAVLSREGSDTPILIALVVPAVLLVALAVFAYRLWRDPYSR
jgi:hypothetical protein